MAEKKFSEKVWGWLGVLLAGVLGLYVAGALILAGVDAVGDFIQSLNVSMLRGAIHASQSSISLSMLIQSWAATLLKALIVVAMTALALIGLKKIIDWVKNPPAPPAP